MQNKINKIPNWKIFLCFLQLGCVAFGGPAAHLVFFHQKFVHQLKWLTEAKYSQIVALSQIIPGPTSSQVGIAIGYVKNGYLGSICAWLGFTLPSLILMFSVAVIGQQYFDLLSSQFFHVIHLIVLAVVIWAFWQMLQSFCNEVWQYLLMLFSTLFIYTYAFAYTQLFVILFAAMVGILFTGSIKIKKEDILISKIKSKITTPPSSTFHALTDKHRKAYLWILLFLLPFLILPFFANSNTLILNIKGFYYSASMVFGGGHIILPLLHQDFVSTGIVTHQQFDLGYAFAQFMPGPLFSFASYLGTLIHFTDLPFLNAIFATLIIFLPSFLLIWGTLPYWSWLMHQQKIRQAVTGINAAVIGLLLCLVIQMTEKNILNIHDLLFVGIVVVLLRSHIPTVLVLLVSGVTYYSFLS